MASTDEAILQAGTDLWRTMAGESPGLFDASYWEGALLDWAMRDPSFKVDLLRFVDVFPSLSTTDQVRTHVREYLLREGRPLPTLVSAALRAAAGGLTAGVAAATIRRQIEGMAGRFIVGADARQALPRLRQLHQEGVAFTVDLLGEATVSDAEADTYARRYLDLIDNLPDEVGRWGPSDVLDRNHVGPVPRTNVSLKLSALSPHIDPVDLRGSAAALERRLLPLFLRARARGVALNLDLEQWALHDVTYEVFERLALHPELRGYPHLAVVVQAYLRRSRDDAERLLALARRRGAPLGVRLVKGAYWDYETVIARQQGWECPVFAEKAATDRSYEAISELLLRSTDHLWPAFASHNLRSLLHAVVRARELGVSERAYEVQMLFGMAEPERKAFRRLGSRVRVYAPVGELLPGMAYLVRRLLENTSNQGFLRLSHHDKVDLRRLLAPPTAPPVPAERAPAPAGRAAGLAAPFTNCPLADFSREEARRAFAAAVEAAAARPPLRVPLVVAGREVRPARTLARPCPSDPARTVAEVCLAGPEHVEAAVLSARAAWPAWRDRPLAERAALLERLGELILRDRWAMAALQCFEVGKPWREADADVAEAVDFCRYYARQALLELAPRRQGAVWGESNLLSWEGRGVCVVIAPWNFPLAILCGMAAAALVAGNTVILKPAEQSSAVAFGLMEKLGAAGFPPEVVQFLPGVGEEIGPLLVAHRGIDQVAFTGSQAVGLQIVAAAGVTSPGQRQVKRVVCEMGGKNAIIVDDDADLDEAVQGVVKSAFGFAGQKCSACSRVIVLEAVAEAFLGRLRAATAALVAGAGHDPATTLPPVVDEEAWRRLRGLIEAPGAGARPLFVGSVPEAGWFVPPALFAVQDRAHPLLQRELFGPILAVHRVATFDEALEVAVSTEQALTGAVYSRSPAHLEEASRRFRVGNLYLNRGSTGALVDRQPFGGFGLSGLGTKAGGPGYLQHFADPRCVTENLLRRGFTPELES